MRTIRWLGPSCVLALLGTAQAQTPNKYPVGTQFGIPVGGTGIFRTTAAGHFTGNLDVDIAVLRGSQLAFMVDMGVYQSSIVLADTVNDFVRVPGGQAAGWDAFVYSGASGLYRGYYSGPGSPGNTTNQGPNFVTQTLWSRPAWANARRVRTGAIAGSVGAGFAAINAAQTAILLLKNLGGTSGYAEAGSVTTNGLITDFLLYDRDGNGTFEIAARTTAGVEIWAQDGTHLLTVPPKAGTTAYGPIEAIRKRVAGSGSELVWARMANAVGSAQELVRIDANGLAGTAIALGGMLPVALRASDIEGDGDDDLLISQQQTHALLLMYNDWQQGAGEPFTSSWDTFPTVSGGGSGLNNWSEPLATDLDNDGDLDLVMPEQSNGSMFQFRNRTIDEDLIKKQPWGVWYDRPNKRIHLLTTGDAAPMPVDANYLQVVVHKTNLMSSYADPLQAAAVPAAFIATTYFPVTAAGYDFAFQFATLDGTISTPPVDCVYFVTQRLIKAVNGTIMAVHAARSFALIPVTGNGAPFVAGLGGFPAPDPYSGDPQQPAFPAPANLKAGDGGYGECVPFDPDLPPWPPTPPPPPGG